MLRVLGVVLALAGVAAAAQPVALGAAPAVGDRAFQKQILDAHNAARRRLGERDLAWSNDLAREADAWARTIAASDTLRHDSQRAHGESIWMSAAGRLTPAAMVQGWIAEKKFYRPGIAQPRSSTTGNWADVAHYTAIVWSTTTSVGCAIGRSARHDFLVCRYDPPGNMPGVAAYDVKAARTAD